MNSTSSNTIGMAELSANMMASFMSSIEVKPSLETKDFECAWDLASKGMVKQALDVVTACIDSRYDDEVLFGQRWEVIEGDSEASKLLNSIGLLYSCRYAEAEDILNTLQSESFRSQTIKARCMEKMECWNAVERIHAELYAMYLKDGCKDDAMYRNFLYRYAVQTGNKDFRIMRDLYIKDQQSDTLLSGVRSVLTSCMAPDMPDNEMVYRFYDLAVSENDFIGYARRTENTNPSEWEGFISFLSSLEQKN